MPTKDQIIEARRKAQEQQEDAQKKARNAEQDSIAQKERVLYALRQPEKADTIPGEDIQAQTQEDSSPVLKAYKEKYEDPVIDEQGRALLSFTSEEAATAFFKEMAEAKYPFLAVQMNGNDYTGNVKLSFGDGNLIEGKIVPPEKTKEFIDKYRDYMRENDPQKREALKAGLMDMLETAPTQKYREIAQQQRASRTSPEIAEDKPSAPNPFNSKPSH